MIVKRILKKEKIVFNGRRHSVYGLVEGARFMEMFGAIANGGEHLRPAISEKKDREEIIRLLKKKKMYFSSKKQATEFCEKNKKNLGKDFWTFLLLYDEKKNEFFVASVYLNSDGRLNVNVHRFVHSRVWDADNRIRVVVSQQ